MSSYKFIYDTETSGLPYKEKGKQYDYQNLKHLIHHVLFLSVGYY